VSCVELKIVNDSGGMRRGEVGNSFRSASIAAFYLDLYVKSPPPRLIIGSYQSSIYLKTCLSWYILTFATVEPKVIATVGFRSCIYILLP
jgi:hypothetical protein